MKENKVSKDKIDKEDCAEFLFTAIKFDRFKQEFVLFVRDVTSGRATTFRIDDFKPYFYVLFSAHIPYEQNILEVDDNTIYKSVFGERLKKIVMRQPGNVGDYARKFENTFESDIVFTQRLLIDLGLKDNFFIPINKYIPDGNLSWEDIYV